ncbi:MAG TPA: hypothetical protein VNL71_17065 [Chloroflexota bacterium]|nr:hypothetical protein [Chloroflexota bacterium]
MDLTLRLARLCLVVGAAGGHIEGRRRLLALAYLCQHAGTPLGQRFHLELYRLQSDTLGFDLTWAAQWRYLDNGLGPHGDRRLTLRQPPPDQHACLAAHENAGLFLIREIAQESDPILDMLALIAYLHARGYREQALSTKLNQITTCPAGSVAQVLALARLHAIA